MKSHLHRSAFALERRTRGRLIPAGRADLHVHTSWSDGAQPPAEVVRAAAGRVEVLGITDHDEIRGALEARTYAERHPELGVEVVVGEEISTLNGHVIGLWLTDAVPPGLTAERTIDEIHAQGGLAIAAHPFHPYRGQASGHVSLGPLIPTLPFDAIEAVNNAGVWSVVYDARAALRNLEWALPVTGGSDAHDVWHVGSGVTRFDGRKASELRAALEAGRTRAHVIVPWTLRMLPRHVSIQLRALHRFATLQRRRLVDLGIRGGELDAKPDV